jgi:cysteine desulfurase
MAERAYFDWNATAPLRPEARAAMVAAMDLPGNPSSVHGEGRAARGILETARERVAKLVGALPKNVTFTSGGTEANTIALTPDIDTASGRGPFDRLFISAVEHPSVRVAGRFAADAMTDIPVTADGLVDLPALRQLIASAQRPLVSVMLANNETGAIQPISEIAQIVHEAGGLLHVDAVQALGKIPIDINVLQIDLLVVSAHKIGGPKGVGALIRRDEAVRPTPVVSGGGQERGLRGGTENLIGIAGFGAAAEAARQSLPEIHARMKAMRDRLEARLKAATPNAVVISAAVDRLPNTTLIAVPGLKAETAVIAFDLAGVAVSSGSACSSGKVAGSQVLAAMKIDPDVARGALRLSLGWETTDSELETLISAWNKVISPLAKGQTGIAA